MSARLRVIGCGDAFGSGGRGNTCFLLDFGSAHIAADFGATALVDLKRAGLSSADLDAVVLTHLHGDHFGGIPFLLLDAQFGARRRRPLTILGPVGTAARLRAAQEVFFPGTSSVEWSFPLRIVDVPCGETYRLGDVAFESAEVVHASGAPATGIRLSGGGRLFAYSGDTTWTDALLAVAADADLFIVDCHDATENGAPHLDFRTVRANRDRLRSRRIMLTHLGDAMLDRMDELATEGFVVAHDGLVLDL